ncbi:MAG: aminoacyl-tRNA hydrolase, partial [Hyphomicrobiaceae bacterium]
MKLLVGLGNPGAKFARNRHNVGFLAVDRIASTHGAGPWRKKFQGQVADATIAGERVLLLKPETFMNESGRSVGEAARFLKVPIGDVVVLYDEIDLTPGKLKVKVGGGNAGHNGLRSISAHLDNDYVRVRIGVGHPGHKDQVANYVLSDFAKADMIWLEPMLEAIAEAAGRLVTGSNERFLTDVALALGTDEPKGEAKPDKIRREKPAEEASPAVKRGAGHPA